MIKSVVTITHIIEELFSIAICDNHPLNYSESMCVYEQQISLIGNR